MSWLSWILSNVVLASLMALVAVVVQRQLRLPAVARIIWVLVFVKLVTPPLVNLPLVDLPRTMACVMGVCNCEHVGAPFTVINSVFWGLLVAWSVGALATG